MDDANPQHAPGTTAESLTSQRPTEPGGGRNVWATIAAIVLILGLAVGAVVFLTSRSAPTSDVATPISSTSATTVASTTATTPTPGFHGDARTLLLPVPVTATSTPIPGATDNVMTADQVAANYSDKAAGLRQLQDWGYQQGAQLQWIEPDGTWIGVILYQFADATGASSQVSGLRDSFSANDVFADGVDIPGVANGTVFARNSISDNGRWFSEAVFSRNTIAVELFVTGPVRHDPSYAAALAQSQYARLP